MEVTGAQVVAIVAGVGTFLFVLELVRRRQLREKYAVLWFVLALGMTATAIWPGMLETAADALGMIESVNVLYFAALLILFGIAVHLSWELSRLENETRTLSEEVALLRLEVETQHPRPDDPSRTQDGTG